MKQSQVDHILELCSSGIGLREAIALVDVMEYEEWYIEGGLVDTVVIARDWGRRDSKGLGRREES